MRIEINDFIVVDPEICHGKPTFKGTRIMVHIILEMLEAGATIKEIFQAYPPLTEEHVKAAYEFAIQITEKSFELRPI